MISEQAQAACLQCVECAHHGWILTAIVMMQGAQLVCLWLLSSGMQHGAKATEYLGQLWERLCRLLERLEER